MKKGKTLFRVGIVLLALMFVLSCSGFEKTEQLGWQEVEFSASLDEYAGHAMAMVGEDIVLTLSGQNKKDLQEKAKDSNFFFRTAESDKGDNYFLSFKNWKLATGFSNKQYFKDMTLVPCGKDWLEIHFDGFGASGVLVQADAPQKELKNLTHFVQSVKNGENNYSYQLNGDDFSILVYQPNFEANEPWGELPSTLNFYTGKISDFIKDRQTNRFATIVNSYAPVGETLSSELPDSPTINCVQLTSVGNDLYGAWSTNKPNEDQKINFVKGNIKDGFKKANIIAQTNNNIQPNSAFQLINLEGKLAIIYRSKNNNIVVANVDPTKNYEFKTVNSFMDYKIEDFKVTEANGQYFITYLTNGKIKIYSSVDNFTTCSTIGRNVTDYSVLPYQIKKNASLYVSFFEAVDVNESFPQGTLKVVNAPIN